LAYTSKALVTRAFFAERSELGWAFPPLPPLAARLVLGYIKRFDQQKSYPNVIVQAAGENLDEDLSVNQYCNHRFTSCSYIRTFFFLQINILGLFGR